MNGENSRAHAGARNSDMTPDETRVRVQAPAMAVVSVAVLPGDRRTPRALVKVRVGPVEIACSYARLRRQRWEVLYPKGADGEEGIALPEDIERELVEMVRAAVEGDAEVARGLRRWW